MEERRHAIEVERETAKKVNVLLQIDPGDGNDPIEADVWFQEVPQKGQQLEFWDKESGHLNSPTEKHPAPNWSGEPIWAEVELVTQCVYAPERIVVSIRFEGFDLEQVRRVMERAQRDDEP